jgi:hypothetical protein
MPYVLVQEEGGFDPVMDWFVADPQTPASWDDLCQILVQKAVERNRALSVNVFLVFDQEDLARRDRPALEALIDSARRRAWGASVLLVLSNPPDLHGMRSAWADLAQWLCTALFGRVEDLLETSESVNRRAPNRFLETLRDLASETKARREMLKTTAGHRRWRCALPAGHLNLSDVLGPAFLAKDDSHDPASDTIVVLSAAEKPEKQIERIERHLDNGSRSRCRVVMYRKHDPSPDVRKLCDHRNIPDPVEVGGDFELWYLLLRLNEHIGERRAEDPFSVHSVRLSQSPRFMRTQPEKAPELLLTSAFELAHVGQGQAAAKEVGELVHRIPFAMKRRIEMGITRERLSVILEPVKPEVALLWVHMGHGEGRNGLRVPGDGSVGIDNWLDIFGERDLRLALFLTCDSDEIAERFAEEGASVAIGFHGKVESDKTWHLAVEVIKAIVAEGTRGGTVLAGFGKGLLRFDGVQTLDARARAYYPRHP